MQPERIGGHTIFESKQVVVDSPLSRIVTGTLLIREACHHMAGQIALNHLNCAIPTSARAHVGLAGHHFDCVISQPWLDWTAEEDGDSRLVRLLKVHGSCVMHAQHVALILDFRDYCKHQ